MKIAILGYGKEGHSAESYFTRHGDEVQIFDKFDNDTLKNTDFSSFDMVLRSPSVHPDARFTSMTRYFFDHCPAPIIGVTGTKGKGTTCSMITAILTALGKNVYLVGNIGKPVIDILDDLKPDDVVVFEMSSFQLWDLTKSPQVAVVLRIEADHLNVHDGFSDYVNAKGHIAEYQKPEDKLVYFKDNEWSREIADKSAATTKLSYPEEKSELFVKALDSLVVPGEHNREDAEAAIRAAAAYLGTDAETLISENFEAISRALNEYRGLPHHIEFVKNVNGVDYYDDSFSASYPSLEVAVKAFSGRPVVLIAGGKDRGLDLAPAKRAIFDAPNLLKVMLMGETKEMLAEGEDESKYTLVNSLEEAVNNAKELAETVANQRPVVLLSPGAASFDMFRDFYDRGDQFKALVEGLK